MATTKEFHDYILECLAPVGGIRTRRMMGEYCVYYRGKVVGVVCDNCLLIKKTPAVEALLPDARAVYPYEGSRTLMVEIETPEDTETMRRVLDGCYEDLS